ncbi:uncharacterized protein LOC116164541 isoform X2 [Photinus pyralis]|uniref:uncharacterized protein LOC116164541 isoform X2 n=1 Tax=Photinus pyralis TaxID=7054 RepID=UPI0012670890|nr:uncharacterized protein LOC116164541 isoform X2 [Photinus pyralis]
MSKTNLNAEEFRVVSYKKSKIKRTVVVDTLIATINEPLSSVTFNLENYLRRIEAAKQELIPSDLYSSVLASLRESFQIINIIKIKEIVCFGLGRIENLSLISQDLWQYHIEPVYTDEDLEFVKNKIYEDYLIDIFERCMLIALKPSDKSFTNYGALFRKET